MEIHMKTHRPIILKNLSLALPHKTCFQDFSATINFGNRIALIGDNGSGKSTLLKMLLKEYEPSTGQVIVFDDVSFGYLPQNFYFDQTETVWEAATKHVRDVIIKLERLNRLTTQPQIGKPSAVEISRECAQLIEEITASNGFEVETKIETLLSQMGLQDYQFRPVKELSGGQQMLLALVRLLTQEPNILLLDEPTNHLDHQNRDLLMSFLNSWKGTALIVSHNIELLNSWPQIIWDIHDGSITIFEGNYKNYQQEKKVRFSQLTQRIETLQQEKKKLTADVQAEQRRSAQSKKKGLKKYAGDKKALGRKREIAGQTTSRIKGTLSQKKQETKALLDELRQPAKIVPKFNISRQAQKSPGADIRNGAVAYDADVILDDINLFIAPLDRVALIGENGSGKSTFIKALLNDPDVHRDGDWNISLHQSIGYLDQHQKTLDAYSSPFEAIKTLQPMWDHQRVRRFLNNFLFRKNEEVMATVSTLSGGERMRLALACIAAQSPPLLILDEATNNLDLTTRQHVIDVITAYPGTLIVASHDYDFLRKINIQRVLETRQKKLVEREKFL